MGTWLSFAVFPRSWEHYTFLDWIICSRNGGSVSYFPFLEVKPPYIYLRHFGKLVYLRWYSFLLSSDATLNLISLTVLAISCERVKSMSASSMGDLLVNRVIFGIWFLSFVGAIPTLFATDMVTNKCGDSICVKVESHAQTF